MEILILPPDGVNIPRSIFNIRQSIESAYANPLHNYVCRTRTYITHSFTIDNNERYDDVITENQELFRLVSD